MSVRQTTTLGFCRVGFVQLIQFSLLVVGDFFLNKLHHFFLLYETQKTAQHNPRALGQH